MSYVLEALRRAEAERHRGRVPGLDAQPLPASGAGPAAGAPARRRGLWLGLAVASLLVVGAGGWMLTGAPTAPGGVGAPSSPAPSTVQRPPAALPAPPLAAAPRPPAPRPVPPRPAPAEPPVAAAPAAAAIAPAAAASAGPSRVLRLQDLPEATRRQFPPLVFGGATDSPEASARMLIVNGQVYREGDEAAPGVVLERIALRAAQFRWRGQRIEIAY